VTKRDGTRYSQGSTPTTVFAVVPNGGSTREHVRRDAVDVGTLLLFWIGLAVIVALAANSRGRSGLGWFLLALFFSPILALIAVLVIGPGANKAPGPAQLVYAAPPPAPAEVRKPCPQCGEQVPLIARICRFCRYEFQDVPTTPTTGGSQL
jgi:hypothetical protein